MKLYMIFVCLFAMLLFSASAIADIVEYGDTSGSASAAASHGDEYDEDGDSSDNGQYTTVEGNFSYNYTVYVDVEGFADPCDGWAASTALAYAEAGPNLNKYLEFNTGAVYAYHGSDPTPLGGEEQHSPEHFEAYTGVSAYWQVAAVGEIEEGSWGNTNAWAYAYASAAMASAN